MEQLTDADFENLQRAEPLALFGSWFQAAEKTGEIDSNAMTLATVGQNGAPQCRTVLLKSYSTDGFVFYTNIDSRKGICLRHNQQIALLFYWRPLGRQISIEGRAQQLSVAETDTYYQSRPRDSRIHAWASNQSRPIASLADLHAAVSARQAEFADVEPPLPPHWRGFCLNPGRLEFWQAGEFRLHRRVVFTRDSNWHWQSELLQP